MIQTPAIKLTPREAQIMTLLAQGNTRKEVAFKLNMGFQTVRTHLRNINIRFEARNMKQALAISISHGLIIPE